MRMNILRTTSFVPYYYFMFSVLVMYILAIYHQFVFLAVSGASTANVRREDAGRVLADVVREYMQAMGIQNGITELGFSREDIPALVQGALPQVHKYLYIHKTSLYIVYMCILTHRYTYGRYCLIDIYTEVVSADMHKLTIF